MNTNMQTSKTITAKLIVRMAIVGMALFVLAACGENMRDEARLKPYEPNAFFPDNQSARPLVDGTVPFGFLNDDEHFYEGRVDGEYAETFPFEITQDVLERGQERYNIFCAPCHAPDGYGRGMIVQRGFPMPPSFHSERLREAPVGYFFDVITNGFGVMYPYGYRVPPQDRWAIIAYIRALQLSQHANIEDVPAEALPNLQEGQQ